MWDDFILRAFAAGFAVAAVAGALGCFVIWRKMAYFGDSLAHSALLGIALGLMTGVHLNLGIIIVGFIFALLLVWLQQKQTLATDTLLGVLAHAALAFGLIALSTAGYLNVDLHGYLFGDILTVTTTELVWIYGGGGGVLLLLTRYWPALTLMTVSEDLARAEGVKTLPLQLLLVFLMIIVVAVSIRIVGVFLITALLIIPAAAARRLAWSPESMAVGAAVVGAVSVAGGLVGSIQFDLPAGPAIVATAVLLFSLLFPAPALVRLIVKKNHTQ